MKGLGFLPLVSGLFAGIYLGWFYRNKEKTVDLCVRIGIGVVLGLIIGILPGMVLGTILSIPFPDSFWSFFYLSGHFVSMFIVSVGIARGIVYLGERKWP